MMIERALPTALELWIVEAVPSARGAAVDSVLLARSAQQG
jgi:hypothetical protein